VQDRRSPLIYQRGVVTLLVTVSFLTLVHGLGLSWTFWAYGLVSIGAWFFVKRFVPETKGRSLEQIEKELAAGKEAVGAAKAALKSRTEQEREADHHGTSRR